MRILPGVVGTVERGLVVPSRVLGIQEEDAGFVHSHQEACEEWLKKITTDLCLQGRTTLQGTVSFRFVTPRGLRLSAWKGQP